VTDRVNGFTVVLEQDMREDDVAQIMAAVLQLRGVLTITSQVVTSDTLVAYARARRELGEKLLAVVYPERVAP